MYGQKGYILLETIASISSQSLAERLSGSTLLLYNFVEMHERVSRDRMANADDESFPCEYRAALTDQFKNVRSSSLFLKYRTYLKMSTSFIF